MLQTKEQVKNPPDQTSEEEIGSLPEKEFRVMTGKMIQNLGKKMEKIQETFNKDIEELKRKQTTNNNTINEINNSLEGINSRITEAEHRSDLEDKIVEITTTEQNKEKRMKRMEDSGTDLRDNIKPTNIQIIGVPEEEEKKKGTEKIFEEIRVEKFPNMGKEIVSQVQEAQRIPYRINRRRNTPRHILNKLKNQMQRKNIKSKGKSTNNIQGNPHKTADLSAKLCKPEGGGRTYLK